MHFLKSTLAFLALSASGLAAVIPADSIFPRMPHGATTKCGEVPDGVTLTAGEVHVWKRVDTESITYHGPGGKDDVEFHQDLNRYLDLIGGQHYDVIFGTVGTDKKIGDLREVGLQFANKQWIKKNPSGANAPIDVYNDAMNADGGKPVCTYQGAINTARSTIRSAAEAKSKTEAHYHGKTYNVKSVDCVTAADFILGEMSFKRS